MKKILLCGAFSLLLLFGLVACEKKEIKELKKQGISFTQTSFLEALREHRADRARLFVAAGIDPNTTDSAGISALAYASVIGDLSLMQALLDKGASLEGATPNGQTPLRVALLEGPTEAVRFLVDKGAKLNPSVPGELTPLMLACNKGSKDRAELVASFIAKGADVNARDRFGRTPLMYAAGKIFPKTVRVLVESGADVNARDNEGRSVLFYLSGNAEREKRDGIVGYLKGKGADDLPENTPI